MVTKQNWKIGDAYQLIKEIPSDSIDLVTTDPPYGYSFMGLDWDKAVPKVEIWHECLRVLKPGAFAFVMSSPRQDVLSQMIVRLAQAGFDTNFTSIYWTYASGFPKAMNIGKAVDKKRGVERTVVGTGHHSSNFESAKKNGVGYLQARANKNNTKCFGYGEEHLTIPSSPEAKALDGSYAGFQPKPAVEVIIVAMKPLSEKNFTEQALANGKGITWLDDGRIPFQGKEDYIDVVNNYKGGIERATDSKKTWKLHDGGWKLGEGIDIPTENKGRFPANLLVSDDVLNDGNTRSSCQSSKTHDEYGNAFKFGGGMSSPANQYSDSGSFSRYFDLDRWFEETIKKLPSEVKDTFPFLIVEKPSKSEKNKGCELLPLNHKSELNKIGGSKCSMKTGSGNERCLKYKNNHPTVKPLKLFSYLITLGSREDDTVLDPFLGSGTALRACRLLNRNAIGFELNAEYELIIKGRSLYNTPSLESYSFS